MPIYVNQYAQMPQSVTATLSAGGNLAANTTYYVRVVANESVYGTKTPPTPFYTFTTTTAEKCAWVAFPTATGTLSANHIYNVYVTSDSATWVYGCRVGPNGYTPSGTTSPIIVGGVNGLQVTADTFTTPSNFPNNVSKTAGTINVTCSGACGAISLASIYNAIVASGYTDYVGMSEMDFTLKGSLYMGVNATGSMAIENMAIRVIEGCIVNYSTNFTLRYGNYSATNDYAYNGCTLNIQHGPTQDFRNCSLYNTILNGRMFPGMVYYTWIQGGRFIASFPASCTMKDVRLISVIMGEPPHNITIDTDGTGMYQYNNVTVSGATYINTNFYIHTYYYGGYKSNYYRKAQSHNVYIPDYDMSSSAYDVQFYGCNFETRDYNMVVPYWAGANTKRNFNHWYSLNLKVVDERGNSISGARCIVKNKDSVSIMNTTSNANGAFNETMLKSCVVSHLTGFVGASTAYNVYTYQSPFAMKIEKSGYATYNEVFSMTGNVDWTVTLKKSPYSTGW